MALVMDTNDEILALEQKARSRTITPDEAQRLRELRGQGGGFALGPVGGDLFPRTPNEALAPNMSRAMSAKPVPAGAATASIQTQGQMTQQASPRVGQNFFQRYAPLLAGLGTVAAGVVGGSNAAGRFLGGLNETYFPTKERTQQGKLNAQTAQQQNANLARQADLDQRKVAVQEGELALRQSALSPTVVLQSGKDVLVLDRATSTPIRRISITDPEAASLNTVENSAAVMDMIRKNAAGGFWKKAMELAVDSNDLSAQEDLIRMRADAEDKRLQAMSERGFSDATALRKEFTTSAKEFVTARDSLARVYASAKDPTPAGDLALIFNYMKVLDPGSVVRESEFATASATGSLLERAKAQLNKMTGGERLSDLQRQDFVNRAGQLFQSQEELHNRRVIEYTRLARQFNLVPENVIIDLGAISPAPSIEQLKNPIDKNMNENDALRELNELNKIDPEDMTDEQRAREKALRLFLRGK